jgi:hypothetical protein
MMGGSLAQGRTNEEMDCEHLFRVRVCVNTPLLQVFSKEDKFLWIGKIHGLQGSFFNKRVGGGF